MIEVETGIKWVHRMQDEDIDDNADSDSARTVLVWSIHSTPGPMVQNALFASAAIALEGIVQLSRSGLSVLNAIREAEAVWIENLLFLSVNPIEIILLDPQAKDTIWEVAAQQLSEQRSVWNNQWYNVASEMLTQLFTLSIHAKFIVSTDYASWPLDKPLTEAAPDTLLESLQAIEVSLFRSLPSRPWSSHRECRLMDWTPVC